MGVVYIATNMKNGKVYIGMTAGKFSKSPCCTFSSGKAQR